MLWSKAITNSLARKIIIPHRPNVHQTRTRREYCDSGVKNLEAASSAVSVYNIKRTLKASGFDFDDGFTSVKTVCPVCHKDKDKKENIFINKTTGNFICPSCQHVGKWSLLEKFYTSSRSSKAGKELDKYREIFVASKKPVQVISVPKGFTKVKKLTSDERLELLRTLNLETIPVEVFDTLDVFTDELRKSLIFPIEDAFKKLVGFKTLHPNHDEVTSPDVNCPGIITAGPHGKSQKEAAVVVLSILDLIAFMTVKTNYTIICLPHGFKSLPQECLPALERFKQLILWFNYDAPGWDTARNFAKKMEEKRCLFVRPTEAHPTPHAAHERSLDLKGILAKAQPILHKAITTFEYLRQDVLSDLQNIDKVQGVKWKRYPSLNKLLKGHRKGELTVLTGPTGCGKTTFMSEYSLDLALQGVNTLWGSFEIRNTRLAATLLRQMAGKPLDENLNEFDYWADEFQRLPIYFMTFHGQQSIKIVMEAIDHAQYVHDIHHVIIDNVQFMMGISDEPRHMDRFYKQDAIIASFRTFATRRNCHVTLVIHPRKERDQEDLTTSSIFGSAKASQEADNVLIIQDKRLTSVRGKKYLQIAKNRYSGDLGIMQMDFDKSSLSYAQKRKPAPKKSDDEVDPT